MDPALPFQAAPHDAMRLGLASLKEDASAKHPVELIQLEHRRQAAASKSQMLRDVYGLAFAAREDIESQILGKFQRLPGIASSRLGLEAATGTLEDFGFESFLGLPADSDTVGPDLHSRMEQKLGMGTKPVARGFL